jgi:hypothetical protein
MMLPRKIYLAAVLLAVSCVYANYFYNSLHFDDFPPSSITRLFAICRVSRAFSRMDRRSVTFPPTALIAR